MSETLKLQRDKKGRVIARLYGKDFDVTDNEDGKLKAFGKLYKFEIANEQQTSKESSAVPAANGKKPRAKKTVSEAADSPEKER